MVIIGVFRAFSPKICKTLQFIILYNPQWAFQTLKKNFTQVE